MSTGSNPVTTIGTLYFSARGRYSSYPMTVHTCPAARNPWTRFDGEERSASIAGGTNTWEHRMEKFFTSRFFACQTAMALAGGGGFNPTAHKTNFFFWFLRAVLIASRG